MSQSFPEFARYARQMESPVEAKIGLFRSEERLKHLIFGAQLDLQLVESLRESAEQIRRLSRSRTGCNRLRELLSDKRAMLYFTQPSTRTFLSFMAACQILGITCNEVRDRRTSSEVKRESPFDSIRMFSSYFDVIIMRSPVANFAECCAFQMAQLESRGKRWVPIINGGSGADEHPTQALLDVYTIQRSFDFIPRKAGDPDRFERLKAEFPDLEKGPAGKTYCFCGDLGRGRTVRSLATVLAQYSGVKMAFVAPAHDALRLAPELRRRLQDSGIEVVEFDSLDATWNGKPLLESIDCLYMTRIQQEHNSQKEENELAALDLGPFQLTPQRASQLRSYTPILHPFPRDSVVNEIPAEIDLDERAMYFRQARNGMWARAALLVHMFGVEAELQSLFAETKLPAVSTK